MPTAPASHSDPTFRTYSAAQAQAYAAGRGSYAPALYDLILSHHQSTGGCTGLLLDVGCGPGNATRDLAPCFDAAIGADPGQEMIDTARGLGGRDAAGNSIEFRVAAAEDIDKIPELALGRVDLLTAAMSAHWFDMSKFWLAAKKVVRPGGTVAIWTHASLYCHPSTPNAKEVQRILSHLEDVVLEPYALAPNRLSRSLYAELPLPWDAQVAGFDTSSFLRREWDVDGILSDGQDFFGGTDEGTLASLEKGLGTASMVTRWNEAHPEMAHTDQNCVTVAMKQVRDAMGLKAGEEATAKLRTGSASVLLLIKRAA